jgi:predicted aconitase
LTRRILIQGDDASLADKFGGHLMIRNSVVHISGVEFTKMGQKGVMGR